jgi:hypothetical protein
MPSGVSSSTRFDKRGEEMPVVRNEQHRAFIFRQGLDQHFLGVEVEMVGRLVEHQESSADRTASRHDEPRLLATGKHAAFLLDVVAGKTEAAGQRAQRPLPCLRKLASSHSNTVQVAVQTDP